MFAPRFYSTSHCGQPTGPQNLFSLLQDLDVRSAAEAPRPSRRHTRTVSPRFDLRETETHFELFGELPGVDKSNVHIEFSDPQTLVVRGTVDQHRSSSLPTAAAPAAAIADRQGAEPESSKNSDEEVDDEAVLVTSEADETSSNKSFQATVEDDNDDGDDASTKASSTAQPTPATTAAEAEKPAAAERQQQPPRPSGGEQEGRPAPYRFWVSERSYGSFSRSFTFPGRVETEGVTASLVDGILHVAVRKAKKHESRRIAVF